MHSKPHRDMSEGFLYPTARPWATDRRIFQAIWSDKELLSRVAATFIGPNSLADQTQCLPPLMAVALWGATKEQKKKNPWLVIAAPNSLVMVGGDTCVERHAPTHSTKRINYNISSQALTVRCCNLSARVSKARKKMDTMHGNWLLIKGQIMYAAIPKAS